MQNFMDMAKSRVSVREFTDEKVSAEVLDNVFAGLLNTATSSFYQWASVIRVTDKDKKRAIADVATQDYIANVPELFIFIADHHRNFSIFKEAGGDLDAVSSNVDVFMQGLADATLMAQHTADIIEGAGLGSVFLGSILNDVQAIIDILELPEYTMPVLGLAFGHPANKKTVKPKMPKAFRTYENTYTSHAPYLENLGAYNDMTKPFYEVWKPGMDLDFIKQVSFGIGKQVLKRNEYLNVAKNQGYKL